MLQTSQNTYSAKLQKHNMLKKENNQNNAEITRSYYRTYEASPIFTFKNSSQIASNDYWLIDFAQDNTETQKFLPLTNLVVTNNSSEDIYIYINQTQNAKIIPAGSIISFTKSTIPALWSIKIYNAGQGTIAQNSIEISAYKEAIAIDDAFAKMHKAFYKFLFSYRK